MRNACHHRRQYFEQFENPAEAMARYQVYRLRRFYVSIFGYMLLVPMLFAINYLTFHGYWWAWWPALGMSIGLGVRALKLFSFKWFWNEDWEDRKVAEMLAKRGK